MANPDPDLTAQLSLLQDVLGRVVTLEDPGNVVDNGNSHNTHEATQEPRWEHQHRKEKPLTRRSKPKKSSAQIQPPFLEPTVPTSVDCSALSVGDMLDHDVEFCPWNTIVAYPNTFIGKANKPRALPFFNDILERQSWDFFYLHNPLKPEQKRPLLLVQTAQFKVFLRAINEALETALEIPPGVNMKKFCQTFDGDGIPRPRFLLRSDGKHALDKVSWPDRLESDDKGFSDASKTAQDDFISALKAMTSSSSRASQSDIAKERRRKRAMHRHSMMQQAQTFLGLRDGGSSDSVVFVCADIEALESSPHPVSEIGIAILDTKRLSGTPSAAAGSGWWPLIEAHHLRTKEFSGMVNFKYVRGCPDAFNFGTSEFPTKDKLVDAVQSILSPYIEQERKMVFVGHDTASDIRYFSQMGLEVLDLPGMLCVMDTQALHQAWQDSDNGRSLSAVLSDLNMRSKNLHNAGNDAVFTMRAFIGLATEQLRKDEAELRGEKYVPCLWQS